MCCTSCHGDIIHPQPLMLSCGHLVCQSCITRLPTQACPLCRCIVTNAPPTYTSSNGLRPIPARYQSDSAQMLLPTAPLAAPTLQEAIQLALLHFPGAFLTQSATCVSGTLRNPSLLQQFPTISQNYAPFRVPVGEVLAESAAVGGTTEGNASESSFYRAGFTAAAKSSRSLCTGEILVIYVQCVWGKGIG